jgi:hypothetical protein
MSNIITPLVIFKRYTHDNQNTQYEAINNLLAHKRAKLSARIAAHNKKVAEKKANEEQHKEIEEQHKEIEEQHKEIEEQHKEIEEQYKANEEQYKSNRIINNTVINNNVNMF